MPKWHANNQLLLQHTSSLRLYWDKPNSSLRGGGLLYNNLFRTGHQLYHLRQHINNAKAPKWHAYNQLLLQHTFSPWLYWNLTNSSLGGGGLLYKTFSEMGTNSIIRVNTSMMLRCQNDTLITNCCYGTSSPWLYWNLTTSSLGGGGLLYNNLFRAGHQWHHSHQCVNDALITNCCYSTSSHWLYWDLTTSSAPWMPPIPCGRV